MAKTQNMGKAEQLERIRHDPVLERVVLGSIIAEHEQSQQALDALAPDDFFHVDHRRLFHIIESLRENHEQIGLLNLYTEIEKLSDLEGDNLLKFLSSLRHDSEMQGENILEAVRSLRHLTLCRKTARILESAKQAIAEGESAIDEILDTVVDSLTTTMREYEELDEQGISYKNAAKQTLDELTDGVPVAKIRTGVAELDDKTGGFRPGELIIITAETGSGKTLLAQQTRIEACRQEYVSLFCSGEMWARHLLRRELAVAAGIDPSLMRREDALHGEDFARLTEASEHQCEHCRILDGELSIARIRRVARGMKARRGLHLLILDYDELIEAPGKDENEQLRNLVRQAKSISMELHCCVMLISQLRKEYGSSENDDRPPSLSRLYGSGAKIKHAGIIIYADRKWEEHLSGVQKEAKLWLLKNRDGPTGAIPVAFNIQKLRFETPVENMQRSFHDRD